MTLPLRRHIIISGLLSCTWPGPPGFGAHLFLSCVARSFGGRFGKNFPLLTLFTCLGFRDPTFCPLCYSSSKSQDHILMECRLTRSLYDSVFAIFDIHLCYDLGFSSLLLQAQQVSLSKQLRNLWRLTFVTTIWAI